VIKAHVAYVVASAPDLILTGITPAVQAIKRETRTIPIIFANVADPVGSGLVPSLAKPDGNVTGFMAVEYDIVGKWLEDDALQRELVREWLVGEQWMVHEAGNGREALALLRANKPDVILLDLIMPEMDGFQIVAALQKEPLWRDVPVIVITARDLDAKDRERLNSGVHSVLLKNTFRPTELVERIRQLTQTKSATDGTMGATS
jgi:CheY-like chemotaxis protein